MDLKGLGFKRLE